MMIRTATAQRSRSGEKVCGDAVWIDESEPALVVVADGLGHGEEAAEAALAMTQAAAGMPCSASPTQILSAGGLRLASTRGAVAMVARFTCDAQRLVVAGIGNIEVRAMSHEPICPISAPGIVGRRVRRVREFEYRIHAGDLLVFMSDGVSRRMDLDAYGSLALQEIADAILREHGYHHDDATCVAVRVEEAAR